MLKRRGRAGKIWRGLLAAVVVLGAAGASLMQTTPARAAVTCFDNRTNANNTLGSNNVRGVFVSGGTIYAATSAGVSISTDGGANFVNRTTLDGLGNNSVIDVFVSGSNVYAATTGGLSISTTGGGALSFTNYNQAGNGLGNDNVRGVFVSGGTIYAATSAVVSISTDGGTNFTNYDKATNGLGNDYVEGVFVSGSTIYAGTIGGLSISTDGGLNFTNKTTLDGLGDNHVIDVFVSGSNVYAATLVGLSISTDGGLNFTNRDTGDGLGNDWVWDLFVSGGTIYAATIGGLSISTDGGTSFTNLTTGNGLGDDWVWGVYVSGGKIYAGTFGGLSISTCPITAPVVDLVFGNGGWGLYDGLVLDLALTTLTISFTLDVDVTGGAGGADSATNPANYNLLQAGANGTYDFTTCDDVSPGDDVFITIDSAAYNSGIKTATLNLNGGAPLGYGKYRLMVCGTTSIVSELTLPLNGGVDTIMNFELGVGSGEAATSLPATGYPMGVVTDLPEQPAEKAYASYGDLWLEIPSLDVQMEIVGVPQDGDTWDTTWLGDDAGWLNGSAFPTWEGNTVLTGHVWDSWNRAGPFLNLRKLEAGDQFMIHAYGQVYTYEVVDTQRVRPSQVSSVFVHSEYDMVTLVTCESYSLWTGGYRYRRAVSAVLVGIASE